MNKLIHEIPDDSLAPSQAPGGWPRADKIPLYDPIRAEVGIPFIVDTGHECFNPSILRHNGKLIMAWREKFYGAVIWIGELDEDYQLISKRKLSLSKWIGNPNAAFEDPRLFHLNGKLHISFILVIGQYITVGLIEMNDELKAVNMKVFNDEGSRQEKNWQFFNNDGQNFGIYSVNPHAVGRLANDRLTIKDSGPPLHWMEGEARGGTPPVRIGDEYFSFFHSSYRKNYVCGFYAFEAKFPFRITRWPKDPCLVATRPDWRLIGPSVVFPCGAICEEGIWTVSFGWHDDHCCLGQWRHSDLLSNLSPADTCILSGIQDPVIRNFTAVNSGELNCFFDKFAG
jgi:predicted GH43/DUF377 family glycosyl hydrolase